jgi:hypothetical protein
MVPGHVEASKARVAPISGSSVALQVTLEKSTYEKLQYAKELLSHRIPSGDLAQVLDRAMDALIRQLERQKFAATSAPRPARRQPVAGERFVPAYVKRAVWRRDGGQCTFVSESGHRCPARTLLEFDHTVEVARGGQATVGGMRLRCRAHNQHTAEQTFGAGFMEQKQRAAMDAAPERRRFAVTKDQFGVGDVVTCLRALGIRTGDALFAAKASSGMPEAPIETRVRVALKAYGARRFGAPCPT